MPVKHVKLEGASVPRGGYSTRWKPGYCPNPKGRTAGRSLSDALREELELDAPGYPDKTYKDLVARRLIEMALSTDNQDSLDAIREIFDRTEGKPKQQVDIVDHTQQALKAVQSLAIYRGCSELDALRELMQISEWLPGLAAAAAQIQAAESPVIEMQPEQTDEQNTQEDGTR